MIYENKAINQGLLDWSDYEGGHPLLRGVTNQPFVFTLADAAGTPGPTSRVIFGGSVKSAAFLIRCATTDDAAIIFTNAAGTSTTVRIDGGGALTWSGGNAFNAGTTDFYYDTTLESLVLVNDDVAAAAARTFIITRLS